MNHFSPSGSPSFWHDRNVRERLPALDGAHQADVVVIGGGMTGLAAAIELRDQGLDVALLEAGRLSGSATGRNVGFILEGVAESYVRTIALWGSDRAQRARRFTVDNHELIAQLIGRFDIRCGYKRRGSLHLAATDQEQQELDEGTPQLVKDGFGAELVERSQLPAWAQQAGYLGGQLIPGDGELDPVAFGLGLADGATALGVRLYEDSEVVRVDSSSDGVVAHTAHGRVTAAGAVLATNGYAPRITPWFETRIDPTRGQVFATAPLPERLFERPIYASHGFEYWQQLDSGEVVLGGWRNLDVEGEVGYENSLHPSIQSTMEAFLRGLHPLLREVDITHRWSGIMGFSRDSLPIIGPLPGSPVLFAATGFTGHGFGFAVHAARVLRELLCEGTSEWADLFAPRRLA